jgi:hypothetical protein
MIIGSQTFSVEENKYDQAHNNYQLLKAELAMQIFKLEQWRRVDLILARCAFTVAG